MTRRIAMLFAFVLFCAGCVPVTEPVGDIDKSEPDKALVGKWTVTNSSGLAEKMEIQALSVTAPEVKGNPKGLMRGAMHGKDRETPMWFFTSKVGKHTYVNLIVASSSNGQIPAFDDEGAFAEWKKQPARGYFIFHATRDGDKLTLDCGNNETFTALMKDANIKNDGGADLPIFHTPAGWLAKYLDKTGPAKIFDGTNRLVMTREKK